MKFPCKQTFVWGFGILNLCACLCACAPLPMILWSFLAWLSWGVKEGRRPKENGNLEIGGMHRSSATGWNPPEFEPGKTPNFIIDLWIFLWHRLVDCCVFHMNVGWFVRTKRPRKTRKTRRKRRKRRKRRRRKKKRVVKQVCAGGENSQAGRGRERRRKRRMMQQVETGNCHPSSEPCEAGISGKADAVSLTKSSSEDLWPKSQTRHSHSCLCVPWFSGSHSFNQMVVWRSGWILAWHA